MLQDDDEELGDLWQDEQNMAALLLYKQRGRNQYSLVSSNYLQYADMAVLIGWLLCIRDGEMILWRDDTDRVGERPSEEWHACYPLIAS